MYDTVFITVLHYNPNERELVQRSNVSEDHRKILILCREFKLKQSYGLGRDTKSRCMKAIEIYHRLETQGVRAKIYITSAYSIIDDDGEVRQMADRMKSLLADNQVDRDDIIVIPLGMNTAGEIWAFKHKALVHDRLNLDFYLVASFPHIIRARVMCLCYGILPIPVTSHYFPGFREIARELAGIIPFILSPHDACRMYEPREPDVSPVVKI